MRNAAPRARAPPDSVAAQRHPDGAHTVTHGAFNASSASPPAWGLGAGARAAAVDEMRCAGLCALPCGALARSPCAGAPHRRSWRLYRSLTAPTWGRRTLLVGAWARIAGGPTIGQEQPAAERSRARARRQGHYCAPQKRDRRRRPCRPAPLATRNRGSARRRLAQHTAHQGLANKQGLRSKGAAPRRRRAHTHAHPTRRPPASLSSPHCSLARKPAPRRAAHSRTRRPVKNFKVRFGAPTRSRAPERRRIGPHTTHAVIPGRARLGAPLAARGGLKTGGARAARGDAGAPTLAPNRPPTRRRRRRRAQN